jgi:YebC/PmpR family DNA-binding regulatory protein
LGLLLVQQAPFTPDTKDFPLMSGHSKWHTIKHKKGALDAKRGKLFTRIIKEIVIAARHGGGSPESNPRLRTAISAAKGVSMPSDNIKRAILRGTGEGDGGQIDEITFEGYGPGGVAVMINTATDNRNRTVSDIRHAFSKHGGNLGEMNSVSWMFDRRSHFVIEKSVASEDQLMNLIIEAGGDDLQDAGDHWEVLSAPDAHFAMAQALETAGFATISSEIAMIPRNTCALEGPQLKAMLKLQDILEEHDDVQSVFSNLEFNDAVAAAASE